MYRSLLVPLDGTPFGEHALPLAVCVARRTGAAVHLVHVHLPTVGLAGPVLPGAARDQDERRAERAYLAEVAGRVAARAPDVALHARLIEGAEVEGLARALLGHAETIAADLFVLSSHGRTGLARWWYGSLADDLVRRTARPLLLAHPRDGEPAWEPEPAFRHVLVPLDGSPRAAQVLPALLPLGTRMGAEYTLLRVVEPAPLPVVDPTLVAAAPVETAVVDAQQAAAREYLERVAGRLRAGPARPVVRTCVVLDPQPAEAILSFAREGRGVDLIALGTHGRGGLSRLLLDSVAAKVLKQTTVPLLLLRAAGTAE